MFVWAKLPVTFASEKSNLDTYVYLNFQTYPQSFLNLQFWFWGFREHKIPWVVPLFLEVSFCLEVHFLENVETFINKSC